MQTTVANHLTAGNKAGYAEQIHDQVTARSLTDISKVNILSGQATLDKDSWGGALQLGVDVPLDKNWSINLDVKKLYLKTDVYVGGASAGTLKLNPVAASIGVGYRF